VAITSIAILTAIAVDLAYNARVSLQMAANARDELRATYLAKSAVSMSRLVLYYQQRLDASSSAVGSAMAGLQQSAGAQGGAQAALAGLLGGGGRISLRLWDLVPIDSAAASLFLDGGLGPTRPAAARPAAVTTPAAAAAGGAAQEGTRRAFGEFEGSFHATIEDEERKINVRQFDGLSLLPFAQAMRLAQLVGDPKWDFLFDREDANGHRVSRKDLFGAIKDWIDTDETSSTFTGDPAKPFEAGYGDENYLYDRLADRYKAKNAPFDSLDELYMVGGVSDAFMAAFGDKLTVYPDVGASINVNTTDPPQLLVNTLLMSDPPGVPQAAVADPAFLTKLQSALALVKPLPFLSITPQQFATALQSIGVKVQPLYLQAVNTDRRNPFSDTSTTFHIHATGVVGDARKTIDAVVTFDRRAEALAQDQGRLLHWHEE
jgi:general secretion pathway protein K